MGGLIDRLIGADSNDDGIGGPFEKRRVEPKLLNRARARALAGPILESEAERRGALAHDIFKRVFGGGDARHVRKRHAIA